MKTIKRERQVRLDELLKYVIDNNAYGFYETARGRNSIYIREDAITFNNYIIWANDLFKITEEVEITEDSVLPIMVIYEEYDNNRRFSNSLYQTTISEAIKIYKPIFIYLQNEDGSIGELIWDKERGLID